MTASVAAATTTALAQYHQLRNQHADTASAPFMERLIELAQQRDVREVIQAFSNVRGMLSSYDQHVEQSVVRARTDGFEDMRQEMFKLGVRNGIGPEGANRYALPSPAPQLALRRTALSSMSRAIRDEVGKAVRLVKSRGKEVRVLELLSAAERALRSQDYRAERIARTESMWGYNQSRYAMMRELGPANGLVQRWTEMIDDKGKPLDKKVAPDSFAMHGLVSSPGGMFTIPSDARIPAAKHGKRIKFPPMRPNDRAVLTPALLRTVQRGT